MEMKMYDYNITVNYLDKIHENYRDSTKMIIRFQYASFILFFLCAYIAFSSRDITLFGLVKVPHNHVLFVIPLILGFNYMATGALSIYKKRLSKTILSLYFYLGIDKDVFEKEEKTNLLGRPSVTDAITFLAEHGEGNSGTVKFTFSFIHLLQIVFLYMIPLTILSFLIAKPLWDGGSDLFNILWILISKLLLPGVGVVTVTWEYHRVYYDEIRGVVTRFFPFSRKNKRLELITRLIGICIICLFVLEFFLLSIYLSTLLNPSGLKPENFEYFNWKFNFYLFVSLLFTTLCTKGLGFAFTRIWSDVKAFGKKKRIEDVRNKGANV